MQINTDCTPFRQSRFSFQSIARSIPTSRLCRTNQVDERIGDYSTTEIKQAPEGLLDQAALTGTDLALVTVVGAGNWMIEVSAIRVP
jgi:hypothetical protein